MAVWFIFDFVIATLIVIATLYLIETDITSTLDQVQVIVQLKLKITLPHAGNSLTGLVYKATCNTLNYFAIKNIWGAAIL